MKKQIIRQSLLFNHSNCNFIEAIEAVNLFVNFTHQIQSVCVNLY